jgi:hypothetical protein
MSDLLRILELIANKNVEATVTYEKASDSYIFSLTKRDIPIKATVYFSVERKYAGEMAEIDEFIYFLFRENIMKLEKLTAELHEIE